jgi:hypothetical protein
MLKALTHQTVEDHKLVEVAGSNLLSTTMESEASSHWKQLRRAIRGARKNGYASEVVEGTFLYCAFYNPEGVTAEFVKNDRVVDDIKTSGILFSNNPDRNSLVLHGMPVEDGVDAHLHLPFFLYSIPQKAISDLIYGRLVVIVAVNHGRIVEALEREGFQVKTRQEGGNSHPYSSMVISSRIDDDPGVPYVAEFRNLNMHIAETIYEFKSIDYLIEIATSMRESAVVALRQRRHESELDT